MILWIDAQLPPKLAAWFGETFGIEAKHVEDIGLLEAKDYDIYQAPAEAGASVVTRAIGFVLLQEQHGPPPQLLWITCGNTSNAYLRDLLKEALPAALEPLGQGSAIPEISGTT